MKQLLLSKLPALFAALAAEQKLYIPADDAAGQANFTLWREGLQLTKKLNTVRSAKDLFFPQVENLVGFRVTGKQLDLVETRDPAEPFVLFGVRACDARSFAILDRVFLSEPQDTYYAARRAHGTVVTLACTRPEETCFCSTFGIDPAAPEGDARGWIAGDSLYLEALTEKGEKFLAAVADKTSECGDEAVRAQQEKTRDIAKKLPLHELNLTGFNGENMLKLFDSKKWGELSQAGLGCGTCTFVCPTCQCYDIRDFNTGSGITRFRCWDSCMYSDFTKMASGNPRLTQLERFRQRFMHKLVYFPANNEGEYGCVGCGRCLAKCPISMNIVKVAKALAEEVR